MTNKRIRFALLLAALGLVLSVVLRVEFAGNEISGQASICAISSGFDCDAVQTSGWGSLFGVSTSIWGAIGFLTVLAWLLAAPRYGQRLVRWAALFVLLQLVVAGTLAYVSFFIIGKKCLFCLGMQACIVALAWLLWPALRRSTHQNARRGVFGAAALLALAALGLGLLGHAYATKRVELGRLHAPHVSAKMRLDVSHSPTLGDPTTPESFLVFLDFGCPHCLETHQRMRQAVARHPHKAHFFIKHFPIDHKCNKASKETLHPGACDAATAAAAAAASSRTQGDTAAAYLFKERVFYPQVLRRLGEKLGISAQQWNAARADAGARLVARDLEEAVELNLNRVPVAYLNGRPIDPERISDILNRK